MPNDKAPKDKAKELEEAKKRREKEESTKYTELFKKSEVLAEIRRQYTQILDEKFANAEFLREYQDPNDPKKKIAEDALRRMTAATAIQKAYPKIAYDKQGKPIDNREQNYISAVQKFVKKMEQKLEVGEKLSEREQELLLATKVYSALSSVENSWDKIQKKYAEKKAAAGNEQEIYEMGIQGGLEIFSTFCDLLKDSLNKNYQKVLERGERASTQFGTILNLLEDFIDSVKSAIGFNKPKSKDEPKVLNEAEQPSHTLRFTEPLPKLPTQNEAEVVKPQQPTGKPKNR